jgi:hypothetical protein
MTEKDIETKIELLKERAKESGISYEAYKAKYDKEKTMHDAFDRAFEGLEKTYPEKD